MGVWNFDSAARALLGSGSRGEEIEHAAAAVRLAPDLPAARMRLSQALWLHGESPVDALRVALAALAGIPRHLEASLWFAATGLMIAAVGLRRGRPAVHRGGGALRGAARGARSRRCDLGRDARLRARRLPGQPGVGAAAARRGPARTRARAARDRGRLRPAGPARGARAGGRRRRSRAPFRSPGSPARRCSPSAPIPRWTRRSPRPTGSRSRSISPGSRAAEAQDPLAARALAVQARRGGRLGEADARYQALLAGRAGRSDAREQRGERAPLARAHGVRARALRPLARPRRVAAGAVQPGAGLRARLPGRQPGAHARARPGARWRRRGRADAAPGSHARGLRRRSADSRHARVATGDGLGRGRDDRRRAAPSRSRPAISDATRRAPRSCSPR